MLPLLCYQRWLFFPCLWASQCVRSHIMVHYLAMLLCCVLPYIALPLVVFNHTDVIHNSCVGLWTWVLWWSQTNCLDCQWDYTKRPLISCLIFLKSLIYIYIYFNRCKLYWYLLLVLRMRANVLVLMLICVLISHVHNVCHSEFVLLVSDRQAIRVFKGWSCSCNDRDHVILLQLPFVEIALTVEVCWFVVT